MTKNLQTYNYQKAIQLISEKIHLSEDFISTIISKNISIELLNEINNEDELFSYLLIFEEELKYEQSRYLIN